MIRTPTPLDTPCLNYFVEGFVVELYSVSNLSRLFWLDSSSSTSLRPSQRGNCTGPFRRVARKRGVFIVLDLHLDQAECIFFYCSVLIVLPLKSCQRLLANANL